MPTYVTSACAKHGHPEVTLRFTDEPVVPRGERLLLSYFEDAVAQGTVFAPGQTIGVGGHVLRLAVRADGTLGVEEPEPSPEQQWVEQVDRTVREVMFQRYVCDSLKLPLSFPPLRGTCLAAKCSEGSEVLVMTRVPLRPGWAADVSGWTLVCGEDHDHGDRMALPLLALSALKPFAVQFLALPPDSTVLLSPPGHAVVYQGRTELTPLKGSYLDKVNAQSSVTEAR